MFYLNSSAILIDEYNTKEFNMKYVIQLIAFAIIFAGCGSSSSSSSNTPPVANSQSVTTEMDTNLSITLSGTDIDGDTLTFKDLTIPAHGDLTGTAPNVTYKPDAGYTGSDSFTFKVNDGKVDSAVATVSITVNTPANLDPVADAGPDQNVTVGDTVTFDGSGSTDSDGSIVSWVWDENGTEIGTGETFTKSDFTAGSHTVVLTVTDDMNATDSDQVVITVNAPANLVPVATPQSVSTVEDTALTIILSGTDPEGQPLTYAIDTNASNGTLSITDNNVTYTPNANFNGLDSFTFTVNDGTYDSAAATVDINVTAAPDVLKTGQTSIFNSGDDGFYHLQ